MKTSPEKPKEISENDEPIEKPRSDKPGQKSDELDVKGKGFKKYDKSWSE